MEGRYGREEKWKIEFAKVRHLGDLQTVCIIMNRDSSPVIFLVTSLNLDIGDMLKRTASVGRGEKIGSAIQYCI